MKKKLWRMGILCLFCFSFCLKGEGKIYYFDLGTKDSPVMAGFTGINAGSQYNKETGYGWEKTSGLLEIDRGLPDNLARDLVIGANATFKIDLEKGEYGIWIMYGDNAANTVVYPIFPLGSGINPRDREIIIQGKSVFKDYIDWRRFYSEEFFYIHLNSDYSLKDNIWDKYIKPKYKQIEFKFNIEEGPVNITFRNLPVNGFIVYPISLSEKAKIEINYLEKRRKRSVPIEEVKPDIEKVVPVISERDKERGYQIFTKAYWEKVYPETLPEKEETGKPVMLFGTPGEIHSGQIGVYPLKDKKDFKVEVSDLVKGDDGSKISSSSIEIRKVRYVERRQGSPAGYKYTVIPLILEPANKIDLEKGLTRSFFVTVHIPQDAKAGIYRGEIRVNGEEKIPILLRVLPFKLEENDMIHGLWVSVSDYFYYHYWQKAFPEKDFEPEVWKHKESHYKYLKENGINALSFGYDMRHEVYSPDGKNIEMDFNGPFGKWMDLYSKIFDKPMPWYGFHSLWWTSRGPQKPGLIKGFQNVEPLSDLWKAGYKQTIEKTRDEVKKRGWTEILFYISDESANVGKIGAEHSKEVAKVAREVSGIRTIVSSNGPDEMVGVPYIDIIMPNFAFPITEETVKYIKEENKKELWVYNIGTTRFSWGYYPWRIGAKGRFQWHARYTVCFPYDEFDGNCGDSLYTYTYVTPEGPPKGTIPLEELREGIYDYRYIRTLEKLIERYKEDKRDDVKKQVKEAERLLEEIKNSIPWDIRNLFVTKISAVEAGQDKLTITSDWCEKNRWRIAEMIMKLKEITE